MDLPPGLSRLLSWPDVGVEANQARRCLDVNICLECSFMHCFMKLLMQSAPLVVTKHEEANRM